MQAGESGFTVEAGLTKEKPDPAVEAGLRKEEMKMKTRIYNARILTMEEGKGIFEGELWIEGDTITYAGPAKEASDSEDYEKADEDEGQICSMLPILTHSKVEGYRNKCTFTIGKDRNGAPCIGFRMGSFINGNVIIGPIEYARSPFLTFSDVVVVSPLMKQVVKRVEAFIVSKSYQTYDMCQHLGFWRSLLLLYSERTNQLLILVVVGNPYERSLPKAQEALAKLTDATRSEIDGVMKELLAFVAAEVSCIASFNYQM